MVRRKRNKIFDVARFMPPLRHSIPGEEFDIKKSEVVKWLLRNPAILNYVWNNIKQSGVVEYNPKTGTWKGVDYNGD